MSVDIGDVAGARELCKKLTNDKDFYNQQSETSKQNYKTYNSEKEFLLKMDKRLC